jgi:predicted permease
MPEDFLFPMQQKMWVPMRVEASPRPGSGLGLQVFGRLADGVSEDRAEALLSTLHQRQASTLPEERARLRPEVVRYGIAQIGLPGGLELMPEFYGFRILALVLLLVACSNVAMLVFARTATRFRELAVRTALGASRARIVSQIFVETMVLSLLAAGLGIVAIDQLLAYMQAAVLARGFQLPYWLTLRLTGEAVWRALLLAVVSATVAGVVPALRVTGRKIQENIRRADAGRSGIRFGGVTGVLIVLDVAVAVIVVAFVGALAERLSDVRATAALVGIPAEEYLTADVRLPVDALRTNGGEFDAALASERVAAVQLRLVERLEAEPRVRAVAVASALPRMDHQSRRIEVDEAEREAGAPAARWTRMARVDVDFLGKLNQRILSGRDFTRSDASADEQPVIVNTVFAERMFGGRNPVGRRLRFVTTEDGQSGPWHEIVGMIGHLGVNTINPEGDAAFYVPAAPGTIHPMRLAIHLGDSPATFTPRLRQIASEVDPTAVVGNPVVLSTIHQGDWYLTVAVGGGLFLLVIVLVALASSGLYAIISFAVSERTREIGIRTALGASTGSIVLTILRRSLLQIGIGALLGMPVAGRVFFELREDAGLGEAMLPALFAALAIGTGVVLVIGLLSCVVPARRALRIRPAEALRAEA